MQAPSAVAVLEAWEHARSGDLAARVVALLGLVVPHQSAPERLQMPLGARNVALLGVHRVLVGPRLSCLVTCPDCQELNELELPVASLMLAPGVSPPEGLELRVGEHLVRFRLPNTADLVHAVATGDPEEGRQVLFARCLLSAEPPWRGPPPDELVTEVARAMGQADPPAELLFRLKCVGCAASFSAALDPAWVLWSEVEALSARLMAEVDALARVYHWTESEILALSPARRRTYLAMVGA